MEIFLDKFLVFGTMEQHANCLQNYFNKYMEFRISINVTKSTFLVPFRKVVGRIVSKRRIATNLDKVAAIVTLPMPTIVTKVKGFFGHSGYFCKFIFRYAIITMPLTELLKKNVSPAIWIPACTNSFNTSKHKLVTTPVLIPPIWEKDFHIF